MSSPRQRAVATLALAGLDVDRIDDRLVERDYGDAEGFTTAQMQSKVPGWSVWTHEPRGGETLDDVAHDARAILVWNARSSDP